MPVLLEYPLFMCWHSCFVYSVLKRKSTQGILGSLQARLGCLPVHSSGHWRNWQALHSHILMAGNVSHAVLSGSYQTMVQFTKVWILHFDLAALAVACLADQLLQFP